MPRRNKIALIGAGNIGGELAALAARRSSATSCCSTSPRRRASPRVRRWTWSRTAPSLGYDAKISGTSNWDDIAGADVVIITAGVPRKPGMSRDDLLGINLKIIRNVAREPEEDAPDAFVIVISNPLDAMVYEMKKVTGFPASKVVGMAGVLDSGALPAVPRARGGVSRQGRARHGARRPRRHDGAGDQLLHRRRRPGRQLIAERQARRDRRCAPRNGGGEIVKLMGTSAYYAPASAAIADGRGVPARTRSGCCLPPRTSRASTATRTCTSASRW